MAWFLALKSAAQAILQSKTVTAGTSASTVTPDSGYDGLSSVTVNPTPSQAKSVTATTTAQTVAPDAGNLLSSVTVNPQNHTATYTASTRNAALDMGANNNNRYVDTTGVPNSNSGVKTITSSDANWYTGNVDMGATNSYRYVNAINVYNKGKEDAISSYELLDVIIVGGATKTFSSHNGHYVTFVTNVATAPNPLSGLSLVSSKTGSGNGAWTYKITSDSAQINNGGNGYSYYGSIFSM